MDPDNKYKEEAPVPMAGRSADRLYYTILPGQKVNHCKYVVPRTS